MKKTREPKRADDLVLRATAVHYHPDKSERETRDLATTLSVCQRRVVFPVHWRRLILLREGYFCVFLRAEPTGRIKFRSSARRSRQSRGTKTELKPAKPCVASHLSMSEPALVAELIDSNIQLIARLVPGKHAV